MSEDVFASYSSRVYVCVSHAKEKTRSVCYWFFFNLSLHRTLVPLSPALVLSMASVTTLISLCSSFLSPSSSQHRCVTCSIVFVCFPLIIKGTLSVSFFSLPPLHINNLKEEKTKKKRQNRLTGDTVRVHTRYGKCPSFPFATFYLARRLCVFVCACERLTGDTSVVPHFV
jgi:hypothetical protein